MAAGVSEEDLAKRLRLTIGQVQEVKARRGLTTQALGAMPDRVLKQLLVRLPLGDLPRQRALFRYHQSRDDRGMVPRLALAKALELKRAAPPARRPRVAGLPTGPRLGVGPRALPPTAGLDPGHGRWTAIGPGNIGGRIRSIVFDPADSKRIWVGSVGGGIWKTQDGGTTWAPVDDLLTNLAVSSMAMDPSNAGVLYAGTGEGFFNVDAIRGAGIFQTTDATNWKQLAGTVTGDFQSVNRLAVAADGSCVLAATETGVFRSTDAPRQTWTNVQAGEIAFVACHPTDANKAVAGDLKGGQAYFSRDGGATWNKATGTSTWTNRVELAYSAKDPSIVYASVNVNGGEIWRSTDGGQSYTKRTSVGPDGQPAKYLGDQGWYGNCIWAGDPTNSDLVVVGGVDLWRSTNGGNNLIDISTWWDPRSCHADHHRIVADPKYDGTTNKTVLFGNDGGIYETADVTTVGNDAQPPRINGWMRLDNTFGVTQFYGGTGNAGSGTIVGGAQDNGTLTFTPANGPQKWGTMFGGDGGFCAADPTDNTVFYGEYVYLNICRSTDGGASADYISGQFFDAVNNTWAFKPAPFQIPDAANGSALFIAPFVIDPQSPTRILGGGMSLWRTNDSKTANTNTSGPSWASIKDSVGSPISAIAIGPGNSDIIWVGHDDGQVYLTTNGTGNTPTWQRVDGTGSNPLTASRSCTRICIDANNRNTVYVTFSGYVTGNVWKTTDAGQNWSNIGAFLPRTPIRSFAIHPNNAKLVYLGSEVGVFASEDAGNTWSPTNEGPTNCSVDDLFWMGTVLVAVTHGRGMFTIDLSASGASGPKVTSISPTSGPAAGGTTVTVTGTGFTGVTSVGFGNTGVNVQTGAADTQLTVVSPGGTGTVDITVTTPSGTSATSANDRFTYTATGPVVSSISPTSGPATGGTTVTVNGTAFTGVTSVAFGNTGVNVQTGATDTQLSVVSPGGAGTVDITVTTPSGTSVTSVNDQFTYTAAAPTVSSISPTNGPATGGTNVTVNGTGFTGVTSVGFGNTGVNVQTGATDTQLTVVSPGGTGTVDITVTTPSGTSATSANDQFTYTAAAPTVSSISPMSGPAAGGTNVTVNGTGFTGVTSVGFGDVSVNVQTGVTDTQLTVVSPGGTGTVDITVTTPSGTSATSANDQFTYTAAAPTVSSISPTSGPATGGTSVTVTGTGFTGVTSVGFGNTGVNVQAGTTDTQLTVVSPGGTGAVDITVTTPSGTSAIDANDQFTYV